MSVSSDALTDDAVLGGRLRLRQPASGHRVGHDAILLAAATAARSGEHAVDLGAGVGAAGLALAARVNGLRVSLVDVDIALVALAAENAQRNGLAERVGAIALDVASPAHAFAATGLQPECADRVLMNPPFHNPARQNVSPDLQRRFAHAGPSDLLATWIKSASRLLPPNGTVTLIWRADGLGDIIGLLAGAFGGLAVLPVHSKPQTPAIRILVRAVKGSRAPLALYPAFLLNDACGRPTPDAEAILRGGSVLPLAEL